MKTPLVIAGALLLVANLGLALVVSYSVRAREGAEVALAAEKHAHAATQSEVDRLKRQIDHEQELQKQLARDAVRDLGAKQKEIDAAWALAGEMAKPFVRGERYDDSYRIEGCSATALKLLSATGGERWIPTKSLEAYWKARAGVTVIDAYNN